MVPRIVVARTAALILIMTASVAARAQTHSGSSQRIEPTQPVQSMQPMQPQAPLPGAPFPTPPRTPPTTAPGDSPGNTTRAPEAGGSGSPAADSPWPTTPEPPVSGSEIQLEPPPADTTGIAEPPPPYRTPFCTTERQLRGDC